MDRLKKERIKNKEGWIGVDLDGTLAEFPEDTYGYDNIGAPIPAMVKRVKNWLAQGREVRIFTARLGEHNPYPAHTIHFIWNWLDKQGLPLLEITNEKDVNCIELWDDRAVQVDFNKGTVAEKQGFIE